MEEINTYYDEEKLACPICREEIVKDSILLNQNVVVCQSCECRFNPLQVKRHCGFQEVMEDRIELERRLNASTLAIREKDNEINVLTRKLEELEKKVYHLLENNFKKSALLQESEFDREKYFGEIQLLSREISELKNKITDLKKELSAQHDIIENKNSEIKKLEVSDQSKDLELKSLSDRLQALTAENEENKEKCFHNQTELSASRVENSELALKLNKLNGKLLTASEQFKIKIKSSEEEIGRLHSKVNKLELDFTYVLREYAYVSALITKKRANFEEVKSYLEKTFDQVNSHIENKSILDTNALDDEKVFLHPEYKKLIARFQNSSKLVKKFSTTTERLKFQVKELKNNVESKDKKLEEFAIRVEGLLEWNDIFLNENKELENKLKSINTGNLETEDSIETVVDDDGQLKPVIIEENQTENTNSEEKIEPKNSQNIDNEIQIIIKNDAEIESPDLENEQYEKVEELFDEIYNNIAENERKTGGENNNLSEIDSSELENTDKSQAVQSININDEDIAVKLSELNLKMCTLQNLNEELQKENIELKENNSSLTSELEKSNKNCILSTEVNNQLKEVVERYREELDIMKAEILEKDHELERNMELLTETAGEVAEVLKYQCSEKKSGKLLSSMFGKNEIKNSNSNENLDDFKDCVFKEKYENAKGRLKQVENEISKIRKFANEYNEQTCLITKIGEQYGTLADILSEEFE